jgi:hypothetical protein
VNIAGMLRRNMFVFTITMYTPFCLMVACMHTRIGVPCVAPIQSRFHTLPTVAIRIAILACGMSHPTMLAFHVASVVKWSRPVDDILTQTTNREYVIFTMVSHCQSAGRNRTQ